MGEIHLLANAKLNLSLDIVGRREDGYHFMDMVNQSIDLADEIGISMSRTAGIQIKSNTRFMPCDERNLAYKAASALCAHAGCALPNITITIKKRIPTQAGLGGGSADAAATLIGLNKLLNLGVDMNGLCAIGLSVGADVPFCLVGGTARVTGIGEDIEPIASRCDYCTVVAMPPHGRSTREAFQRFDGGASFLRPDIPSMLRSLADGDTGTMAILLRNVFFTSDPDQTSETLMTQLLAKGALGASLSGSGAAVFGVFPNHLAARRALASLRAKGMRAYIARPASVGVIIKN